MHEAVTEVAGPPVRATSGAAPRERSFLRVSLRPAARLTRAHLSIARRPRLREAGAALAVALSHHLSVELGTPVRLEGHLTDATLDPMQHLARPATFALLEVRGDALAVLELDALAVGALLQPVAGSSASTAAPLRLTRIEEAALGWLLLSVLSAARALPEVDAHFTPRLVSLHTDRREVLERLDTRRRHLAVAVGLSVQGQNGAARLLLPSSWLERAAEATELGAPAPRHPSVARAALDATLLVGSLTLPGRDAGTLVPGDVLVFPGVTVDGQRLSGPGRITTPSFELRGAFGADGFTLTRATERAATEPCMSTVDPTVPVEVEVELTRLRLPLDQLGLLRPGSILPLHAGTAQTVVLRIGDRPVARAELVDIDGELGARVLSML